MSLIDRLERALEQGVDPDVFERAACALLEDKYQWLSCIEAGKDFGRDADIYGIVSGDSESRGRLLATTGAVLSNLKRSHKSWIRRQTEGEFRVDALVVASPNALTASVRRDVEDYCRDRELPLPHFYGRRWLVNALLKNPYWRETLTGVKGRIEAIVPARLLILDPPLIGRETLLTEIQDLVDGRCDLVLEGVPGVGKSRLVLAIDESIYVVQPLAKDHLIDDLLALTPTVIAVDDAHLHGEMLSELARIRTQEGLKFTIIATTWPHGAADTASRLPGSRRVTVDPLPKNLMDQLIRNRGVQSVHARHVVLNQAEGRPGWAMTLCDALISRDGDRVLSGEVLLEHAVRCVRAVSDSELTVDALACVAALNGASFEDLETVGNVQKRAGVTVISAMNSVATSGLIELRHNMWHLQPSLRAPIVAHWFFGPQRRQNWDGLLRHFHDRHADLTSSMLEAAYAAKAVHIRGAAWDWARSLPPPAEWDEQTIHLVQTFGLTDREAADWAAAAARIILATPEEPEVSPWGTVHYPLTIAAKDILRSCVKAWFNEEAVHGLLDLTVGDVDNHSEHPLKVLGDMAHHLDPDRGTLFEIRPMLVRYATSWITQMAPDAQRWATYCEVLRSAFSPSVEGTWLDPAQLHAIAIANAVETAEHLGDLIALWPSAVEPFCRGDVSLPAPALNHLLELFEDWLHTAGGHARGTAVVTPDQRVQAEAGAWAILKRLVSHVATNAGATLKIWQALDLADRWHLHPPDDLRLPEPDLDLGLFVGRRDDSQSIDAWIAHRDEEQRRLAHRLDALGPDVGTAKFREFQRLSDECDLRADGQFIALTLAGDVTDPAAWISPAIGATVPALVYFMVREARDRNMDLNLDDLRRGLADPVTRGAVIRAVLYGETLDDGTALVISELNASDAGSLEHLLIKNEADPVLLELLEHPVPETRAAAAIAFAVASSTGQLCLRRLWSPGEGRFSMQMLKPSVAIRSGAFSKCSSS